METEKFMKAMEIYNKMEYIFEKRKDFEESFKRFLTTNLQTSNILPNTYDSYDINSIVEVLLNTVSRYYDNEKLEALKKEFEEV